MDGRGSSGTSAQSRCSTAPISALHTTTELLKQTLWSICTHPELIQPIRDEIENAIRENGWTTAGVIKMRLLDSIVKESQRLKPVGLG